jgi:hypothetical protein
MASTLDVDTPCARRRHSTRHRLLYGLQQLPPPQIQLPQHARQLAPPSFLTPLTVLMRDAVRDTLLLWLTAVPQHAALAGSPPLRKKASTETRRN